MKEKNIPLNIPFLKGKEAKYVLDCIKSNWVSSAGPYVSKFEKKFKNYVGSKYVVACSSGTAALHLALLSLEIKKGDIVLVSNLTFIASVNAIKYTGATPILIDVSNSSWQMDIDLLETFLEDSCYLKKNTCYYKKSNKKILGILVVHILGHGSNILRLKKLAKTYNIHLIEDTAEALGAKCKNKYFGTIGDIGCYSFNGNKTITTGSGGMLVTNNKVLAKKAKHLSEQARKIEIGYVHDKIGFNYRMSNVHAALGLAQLENIEFILNRKEEIYNYYFYHLVKSNLISFPELYSETKSSHWLNAIKLKSKNINIEKLIKQLSKKGIIVRKLWEPMNLSIPHNDCDYISKKNVSEELYKTCISLPSYPSLKKKEQSLVVYELKKSLGIR